MSTTQSNPISLTSESSKKMYVFSSNGKAFTLLKGKLPQVIMNQIGNKQFTVAKVLNKDLKIKLENDINSASTSEEPINKVKNNYKY